MQQLIPAASGRCASSAGRCAGTGRCRRLQIGVPCHRADSDGITMGTPALAELHLRSCDSTRAGLIYSVRQVKRQSLLNRACLRSGLIHRLQVSPPFTDNPFCTPPSCQPTELTEAYRRPRSTQKLALNRGKSKKMTKTRYTTYIIDS